MKRRTRQHQPVEQGDAEAARSAALERKEHPVLARTVEVDPLAHAPVGGWNHRRRALVLETDMGDQRFVEYSLDGFAIVCPPAGKALDTGPLGFRDLGHGMNFLKRYCVQLDGR